MTLKKYLWEKAKKGSFTIEAACVMSLILVAVMGILYLCFFVHNRAWLTAARLRIRTYRKYGGKPGRRKHRRSSRETAVRSWGILDFLG